MKVEKTFVCSYAHITKAFVEKGVSMISCEMCGLCAYTEERLPEPSTGGIINSSSANISWIGLPPLEPLNLKKDRL